MCDVASGSVPPSQRQCGQRLRGHSGSLPLIRRRLNGYSQPPMTAPARLPSQQPNRATNQLAVSMCLTKYHPLVPDRY